MITNTVFTMGASFIAQIISFFVLPLFIKNLGEDLYGIWVISNILLGYLGMFDFGFTQGLQKYIARARASDDKEEMKTVLSTGFAVFLIIGLFLGTSILLGRNFISDFFHVKSEHKEQAMFLLMISGVACLIQWPAKIISCFLFSYMKIKEMSMIETFFQVAASLVLLILITLETDIEAMKVVHTTLLLSGSIVPYIIIRKNNMPFSISIFSFRIKEFKEIGGFSLGMFYSKVLEFLSIQIDPFVIGRMLDVKSVSHYSIMGKLYSIIIGYIKTFMKVILPSIFNIEYGESHEKLETLLSQGTRYRMIFTSFMVYPAIVYSAPFLRLWVGDEYLWLAKWVSLYCLVPLFTPFTIALQIAKSLGFLRKVNIVLTVKALINLIVSIVLVPVFGIGGPMLGTLAATVIFGDFLLFPLISKWIKCDWKPVFLDFLKINFTYTMISILTYIILHYMTSPWNFILSAIFMITSALTSTRYIILTPKEIDDVKCSLARAKNKFGG